MRLTRPLLLAGSFIALLTIVLLTRFPSAGAGALEPKISLLPPAGDVHVGENFDVVAYAEHFDGVGAYELEVRFDDIYVAFVSFDDGDLLGRTGRTVYCLSGPSSSDGVEFGCASTGATPGASGEGILAVFTFKALGVGSTNIRLPEAGLANVNGDSIDVETENTAVFIMDAATGGLETATHTAEAEPTSTATSTSEPDKTPEVTETATPDETETIAPTEETDGTHTPATAETHAPATETQVAHTPTSVAETHTPEPEDTVEVTETPDEGATTTPDATETVAVETETPQPEETPTPGEEKPTETATPDLTKPSETPEGTGTPGFVPPTATPGQQTATTTSVATATNTVVIKTHTPAASTSTSTSSTQPAGTSSPAATVAAAGTTNAVLGTTSDGPTGIVLPVTGTGDAQPGRGTTEFGIVAMLTAIGLGASLLAMRRRRA